ncbi:E3 ubiquitin-protein ligase CHIP-like protein [Obelidium mucronatum]|nr:E3 ubiquitin-protein ligase CHIP-like protein [Obelidium mucronatum]
MDDLFTNLFGHNNNGNYSSSNYNSRPPVPPSNTGRSFSQQQQQPHHHRAAADGLALKLDIDIEPLADKLEPVPAAHLGRDSNSAATNPAELAKLDGNAHFAAHRYGDAIKAYSVAVIRNPANPVYYSNRALRCSPWNKRPEDNGHETPGRLSEAINSLKKAFDLAIASKSSYVDEISVKYRAAKAKRFERQDRKRREDVSDLHRYLVRLVERDRDRQVKQLGSSSSEEIEEVTEAASKRMSEIEALFSQANENSKKRYVPDAFLGKISFEIMTDPVVAPSSGITYDRSEIVSHLQKIGKWDPLTRQPLHEAELVPNLALKEVIEEFLSLNGWAYDY